jgi:hypothetical protein
LGWRALKFGCVEMNGKKLYMPGSSALRPHYLDVDTIFGDLGVNVYIRNTIFRKAPPSVVSGYGKRSINLNKVVATFEKL